MKCRCRTVPHAYCWPAWLWYTAQERPHDSLQKILASSKLPATAYWMLLVPLVSFSWRDDEQGMEALMHYVRPYYWPARPTFLLLQNLLKTSFKQKFHSVTIEETYVISSKTVWLIWFLQKRNSIPIFISISWQKIYLGLRRLLYVSSIINAARRFMIIYYFCTNFAHLDTLIKLGLVR